MEMFIEILEEGYCEHCGKLPPMTTQCTIDKIPWCINCASSTLEDHYGLVWVGNEIISMKRAEAECQIKFYKKRIKELQEQLDK